MNIMSTIGKCSICGKRTDIKEEIISFTNVICECCKNFHKEKRMVCINCLVDSARNDGTTKIYYTGSVHTVPIKFLTKNRNLEPENMKALIKKEYNE